jgi:hypothetical protein
VGSTLLVVMFLAFNSRLVQSVPSCRSAYCDSSLIHVLVHFNCLLVRSVAYCGSLPVQSLTCDYPCPIQKSTPVVSIVQSARRRLLDHLIADSRSVVQSARRRLLAYWTFSLLLYWRLTPVVRIAGSTGLSVLLLLSESRGLPRSLFFFVALVCTPSRLHSSNASSCPGANGTPVVLRSLLWRTHRSSTFVVS